MSGPAAIDLASLSLEELVALAESLRGMPFPTVSGGHPAGSQQEILRNTTIVPASPLCTPILGGLEEQLPRLEIRGRFLLFYPTFTPTTTVPALWAHYQVMGTNFGGTWYGSMGFQQNPTGGPSCYTVSLPSLNSSGTVLVAILHKQVPYPLFVQKLHYPVRAGGKEDLARLSREHTEDDLKVVGSDHEEEAECVGEDAGDENLATQDAGPAARERVPWATVVDEQLEGQVPLIKVGRPDEDDMVIEQEPSEKEGKDKGKEKVDDNGAGEEEEEEKWSEHEDHWDGPIRLFLKEVPFAPKALFVVVVADGELHAPELTDSDSRAEEPDTPGEHRPRLLEKARRSAWSHSMGQEVPVVSVCSGCAERLRAATVGSCAMCASSHSTQSAHQEAKHGCEATSLQRTWTNLCHITSSVSEECMVVQSKEDKIRIQAFFDPLEKLQPFLEPHHKEVEIQDGRLHASDCDALSEKSRWRRRNILLEQCIVNKEDYEKLARRPNISMRGCTTLMGGPLADRVAWRP